MNKESLELTAFLIVVIAILVYSIGWYFHFDEPFIYNFVCIPVLVAILSFSALYIADADAEGRKLLSFLGWGALVFLCLSLIGMALLKELGRALRGHH